MTARLYADHDITCVRVHEEKTKMKTKTKMQTKKTTKTKMRANPPPGHSRQEFDDALNEDTPQRQAVDRLLCAERTPDLVAVWELLDMGMVRTGVWGGVRRWWARKEVKH
jgi:hypothetical protein